jgi:hypothetical protein
MHFPPINPNGFGLGELNIPSSNCKNSNDSQLLLIWKKIDVYITAHFGGWGGQMKMK